MMRNVLLGTILLTAAAGSSAIAGQYYRYVAPGSVTAGSATPQGQGNSGPLTPETQPSVSAASASLAGQEGAPVQLALSTNLKDAVWTLTGNPSWLRLVANGSEATLAGSPGDVAEASVYALVVEARDASGRSASKSLSLQVIPVTATLEAPSPVRSGASFVSAVGTDAGYAGTWTANGTGIAGFIDPNARSTTAYGVAPANVGTGPVSSAFAASYVAANGARATASGTLVTYPELGFASQPSGLSAYRGKASASLAPTPAGLAGTASYALLNGASDISSTLSSLCPGLGFKPSTGVISGTPSANCSLGSLVMRLSDDGAGTASLAASKVSSAFGVSVLNPVLAVNQYADTTVTVSSAVSLRMTASDANGTVTWTYSGLPGGLKGQATGLIEGGANTGTEGVYTVTAVAKDSVATASSTFKLTVAPAVAAATNVTVAKFKSALASAGLVITNDYCGAGCAVLGTYDQVMAEAASKKAIPGHLAAFDGFCPGSGYVRDSCDSPPMVDSAKVLGGIVTGKNLFGGVLPTGGWDGLDFSKAVSGATSRISFIDYTLNGGTYFAFAIKKS